MKIFYAIFVLFLFNLQACTQNFITIRCPNDSCTQYIFKHRISDDDRIKRDLVCIEKDEFVKIAKGNATISIYDLVKVKGNFEEKFEQIRSYAEEQLEFDYARFQLCKDFGNFAFTHEEYRKHSNDISNLEKRWLSDRHVPLPDDDVHITKSNIVEILMELGFSDVHVATEMNWVVDALAYNDIKTKKQLRSLVNDKYIIGKLKQIYIEELKRDPKFPLDSVAVTLYGGYLLKNNTSDKAIDEIRRTVRTSEEYKKVQGIK